MNVLLKEVDGRVVGKLTDFGLSKSKISKTSKSADGTTAYKPPEDGEEELSGAADVFAFGGVLIYLFGSDHVHPFEDLSDNAIVKRMIKAFQSGLDMNIPELETIEVDEIREIATKCMRTQSGERPTAHELLDQFSELCGLSGNVQVENAAEDMTVKVDMKMFKFLMDEMALLKKSIEEKDLQMEDMSLQLQFLVNNHEDAM